MSKNQNSEIEKYIHITVGHDDLGDFLHWWKNHEDEFSSLPRAATSVLLAPATSGSSERNCSADRLAMQERRTK